MTLRFRLPPGGDVPPVVAARRLGLTLTQFLNLLPELQARKPAFPPADPVTGNFDLDAIDVWRRSRFPHLFSDQLTSASAARHARDVVADRLARLGDG